MNPVVAVVIGMLPEDFRDPASVFIQLGLEREEHFDQTEGQQAFGRGGAKRNRFFFKQAAEAEAHRTSPRRGP